MHAHDSYKCCWQALRQKAEAGDKAATLELQEGDELFKQHMDPSEVQRQNRAKMRRVDPTVNLAADGNDRWSESMNARNSSKVGTANRPYQYVLCEQWSICQTMMAKARISMRPKQGSANVLVSIASGYSCNNVTVGLA